MGTMDQNKTPKCGCPEETYHSLNLLRLLVYLFPSETRHRRISVSLVINCRVSCELIPSRSIRTLVRTILLEYAQKSRVNE